MVDEKEILKQYSYKATSNLVIELNRRRGRDRDGVGAQALDATNLPGRMGDRAGISTEKPAELKRRVEALRKSAATATPSEYTNLQIDEKSLSNPDGTRTDVVATADELELNDERTAYVPTTAVSQRAFQALMSFMLSKLGDQPRDLLRSAADETLEVAKDINITDKDRRKNIELILGRLDEDEYARLRLISDQISDFGDQLDDDAVMRDDGAGEGSNVKEVGVAVGSDGDEEVEVTDADNLLDEVVDVDYEIEPITQTVADALDGMPDSVGPQSTGVYLQDEARKDSPRLTGEQFDPRSVKDTWIEEQLSSVYNDRAECRQVSDEVFNLLASSEDEYACEYKLASLLRFSKTDFLLTLIAHRRLIVSLIRFKRASTEDERRTIETELKSTVEGRKVWNSVLNALEDRQGAAATATPADTTASIADEALADSAPGPQRLETVSKRTPTTLRALDLENLKFQRGVRLMNVRNCKLPTGSEHIELKDYDEWHIPAPNPSKTSHEGRRIYLNELPEWAQRAFPNTKELNRMQSEAYACAFGSDENMLLCAPTGAGKTNVAMLTILRAVQKLLPNGEEFSDGDLRIYARSLKVVYVAPMKALVSELVANLGHRLGSIGLSVRELTGDLSLSRREIEETQVIVTTPEKWDVITRKRDQRSFTRLVSLLILDEIHLLHDDRGPVLEALVARTSRSLDPWGVTTRIVGLSATLPNYEDIAAFLRVDLETGMFYFDSSYRPCPLQQCYVGITTKKALKRFQLMNTLTYEKVREQLKSSNQVIVFVHSRKETAATAKFLVEQAISEEIIDIFLKPGSGSHGIVQSELGGVAHKDLCELLEQGVGIHHAGLARSDRKLVEDFFEDGHIKVLVSTATLAWGVNLPAHAVIIKGTQVYSPEQGAWTDLSPLDVMQMMGRAGRPPFDSYGEGFIITSKTDVLFYLSLLNHQLPIESQLISRLIDSMNAEIAMGSISSVSGGSDWLSYTYFFIRMIKNPALYGISADELDEDPKLERRRAELTHTAALQLSRDGLVTYSKKSGAIQGTDLGRVAADFYVSHKTLAWYNEQMSVTTSDVELLRIFSGSEEFRHLKVRDEESIELASLAEKLPIPIRESLTDPLAKANVLLQAFISCSPLDGLALKADMVYIKQSAARLSRAILQLALLMKWAPLVEKCLTLCKSISARQWSSQTPLRQFRDTLGDAVLHQLERKDFPFERYYDLNSTEVGELVKNSKLGRTIHKIVHTLPRLEMDAVVRPLSRSAVEVTATFMPDFLYDRQFHGPGEMFLLSIEDADSERLLHVEHLFLRADYSSEEHILKFVLPITSPHPPQYFIKCRSDKWIVPETVLPIPLAAIVLPSQFQALSQGSDSEPLLVKDAFNELPGDTDNLIVDESAANETLNASRHYMSTRFSHFTPLQTHMFGVLFNSNKNAVVAHAPGVERDICGEVCLIRLFTINPASVAVWIAGRGAAAMNHTVKWLQVGVGKHLGLRVRPFSSERVEDISLLKTAGTLVVSTPESWDRLSRRWRERRIGKLFKRIKLIIVDNIDLLSEPGGRGASLELAVSRMRYIAADSNEAGEESFRIVALSDPLANAREIGLWLGASATSVFSFHPQEVQKSPRLDVQSFGTRSMNKESLIFLLSRHVANVLKKTAHQEKTLVFVSASRTGRHLAKELVSLAPDLVTSDKAPGMLDQNGSAKVRHSDTLSEYLKSGICFMDGHEPESERRMIESAFRQGQLRVLITTAGVAWDGQAHHVHQVVIAGTNNDEKGSMPTYRTEYDRSDMVKMLSFARHEGRGRARILILTEPGLKEHYKDHVLEPWPVESQLGDSFADHLNAEIVASVIESMQDAVDYLTWTFFYRRLPKNPAYYGLKESSHTGISNFLSRMVETALSDLEAAKCVACEGEDEVSLGALNLGIIASHYYIRCSTVELFASSISSRTRMKGLLEIVSLASEFESIPLRHEENELLILLSEKVRIPVGDAQGKGLFCNPHAKIHLLLQSQIYRVSLPAQLHKDKENILHTSIRLLRALVDVISSAGWLRPALAAVELSQMLIQAVSDEDSPLLQLPHITNKVASVLKEDHKVEDVFDFLDMDSGARASVLQGLSKQEVVEVAAACQSFPNLDSVEVRNVQEFTDSDGSSSQKVEVFLKRVKEDDDNEEKGQTASGQIPVVCAPRFPGSRQEGWWVIVGDMDSNLLLTVKHVTLKHELLTTLEFATPDLPVSKKLQLFLISDSYRDCEQEETFEVALAATTGQADGNEQQI